MGIRRKVRRRLYRGGRPNSLARVLNSLDARLFTSGRLTRDAWVTLEVTGRRTGRRITVPLVVTDFQDGRYLTSANALPCS